MKWEGGLFDVNDCIIKRLQRALTGATVLHAKFSRPNNDYSDLSWTFSVFCTNRIVCITVSSLMRLVPQCI